MPMANAGLYDHALDPVVRRVTSDELDSIIKADGGPYMSSGGNIVPFVSPLYHIGDKYYYTYDDLHTQPQGEVNG